MRVRLQGKRGGRQRKKLGTQGLHGNLFDGHTITGAVQHLESMPASSRNESLWTMGTKGTDALVLAKFMWLAE